MDKKKIKFEYEKKIKLINNYNKDYYEKSQPIVDDNTYDKLKKEILKLESEFNFLKSINSPSVVVGYKPSKNFKKVLH